MFDIEPVQKNIYSVKEHQDYGKIYFAVYLNVSTYGIDEKGDNKTSSQMLFQGSVTDCYSYIKLKEGGYL